ncbi:alpha/beta fold hydrolase [Lentzea sp. NPDC059081]|uniref:alpha/beta fold hydrolase n=1 Tax=Lentzea sp. NPDC059081 TaxID=3346719 RepID=UPI0036AED200
MPEITAHHGLFRNTNLHVDDTGGPGRPIVLVHGWPLSGESWKYQVPALTDAGYRVVTYDRRGFGRSDKPLTGYGYDTLAEDLHTLLAELDLRDVTLVGFSMGGGEVARYVANYGPERLRSIVFASAVPPYLLHSGDNPEGPLTKSQAAEMAASLTKNQDEFYDQFVTEFFSANGELRVTQPQWQDARALCEQADKKAALACMTSFGTTDFRDDLAKITVPTLVLHGDSDATVPFEGSGARTHAAVAGSQVHVVTGGPHGVNVSHADEWNRVLLEFLR